MNTSMAPKYFWNSTGSKCLLVSQQMNWCTDLLRKKQSIWNILLMEDSIWCSNKLPRRKITSKAVEHYRGTQWTWECEDPPVDFTVLHFIPQLLPTPWPLSSLILSGPHIILPASDSDLCQTVWLPTVEVCDFNSSLSSIVVTHIVPNLSLVLTDFSLFCM